LKKLAKLPARRPAKLKTPAQSAKVPGGIDEVALLGDLRTLVQAARQRIATAAYSTQTLLCWHVGRRLSMEHLQGARASYGKQILVTVSRELTADYGRGFGYAEIARMIQFAQIFPDETIVVTLSQQLSWSHFHALLPIKDPLARDFYAEMCRIERWDVRTLRLKIGGMLFQRTALSKKPGAVISAEIGKLREGQMSPDTVFRDPYLLDLLGLKGAYSERDLESAILRDLEGVLLDKHERVPGEEAPIGLILCASADAEQVELLQLDAKSIRVSEYLTALPPLPLLRARLHQAIEHAREHAARRLPYPEGRE
jgi:DUF1016 N-terminal domain